jgi:hypothetical protein
MRGRNPVGTLVARRWRSMTFAIVLYLPDGEKLSLGACFIRGFQQRVSPKKIKTFAGRTSEQDNASGEAPSGSSYTSLPGL